MGELAGTHEVAATGCTFATPLYSYEHWGVSAGNQRSAEDVHSTSLRLIPKGYSWNDSWVLVNDLMVEIQTSRRDVLATTFLTLREFGTGLSQQEAIEDLLTSLSDYCQSLEGREERLAPDAAVDLSLLRALLHRDATR